MSEAREQSILSNTKDHLRRYIEDGDLDYHAQKIIDKFKCYEVSPDQLKLISDEEIKEALKPIYGGGAIPRRYNHDKSITWAFQIADAIAQAQLDDCRETIRAKLKGGE